VLALTFDDGPAPRTPAVLEALAEAGMTATFFALGEQIERHPDLLARVIRRGTPSGRRIPWGHLAEFTPQHAEERQQVPQHRLDPLAAKLGRGRIDANRTG
jgi:peptidoglycan/xylan/chitin deacetylase (PgdA/CDA1 family)